VYIGSSNYLGRPRDILMERDVFMRLYKAETSVFRQDGRAFLLDLMKLIGFAGLGVYLVREMGPAAMTAS